MKLFLASEAKHPESIKMLSEFVGGFEGKSIAYIPTAANGDGIYSWKTGGGWQIVNNLRANVTLVQLEDYRSSEVISQLEGKDIIWIAGGFCGYLMYWMRRTELDIHIREILEQGTVYVGSSAGSMIASPGLEMAEWYLTDQEHGASILPGLGLVDFDIFPHYEESQYDDIKSLYRGKKLYLLKNGEEVTVDGKEIRVFGVERIIT
ncbi:type 1 glutamine amidotransferase-like domain-containing protein [Candidatus Roizmanbacteria bacterium]|nr:type 1 glutamine amidotransferase-like domain-containing protein [Candidatus Roizmanbacteria bacterium]